MNKFLELCPICIENLAENYTECNHGYCIGCLCRIKKCAMCRNPLQRAKICIQIKLKVKLIEPNKNPLIFNNSEDFDRRVSTPISRNGDLQTRIYLPIDSAYYNNNISYEYGRRLNQNSNRNPYTYPRGRLNSISTRVNSLSTRIFSSYLN